MSRGPVRVFLLQRHVTLDHAGELAAGPRTNLNRVDGALLSGIAVEIEDVRTCDGIGACRRHMHLVFVLYHRLELGSLIDMQIITSSMRFTQAAAHRSDPHRRSPCPWGFRPSHWPGGRR